MLENLIINVEKITYNDPSSGYTVMCCSTDDNIPNDLPSANFPYRLKNPFTSVYTDVSNFINTFNKKMKYKISGEWRTGKYGKQFEIKKIDTYVSTSESDIINFLVTLDGVGDATAKTIYKTFKSKTMDVIENEPSKLTKIKGISSVKLEKIVSSLEESKKYKIILDFFSGFSISPRKVKKIYDTFGEETVEMVNENPFLLCQIDGITFLDANSIAIDSGIGLSSNQRIMNGIQYVIQSLMSRSGDLFINEEEVIKSTMSLLNKNSPITIDENSIKKGLSELQLNGTVKSISSKSGNKFLYPLSSFICESEVAKRLVDMVHNPQVKRLPIEMIDEDIKILENRYKFTLADKQRQAVILGVNNNISIITGGPGTGKTTILKFILEIYKKHFSNNILLCAPTGRAARRMAESTGFLSASTIHSALDITNDYSWAQSADSIPPLNEDLVVIDESSMIDMELLYVLINSINFETKVIFLGDSEQLPSVGPGNCLREMIKSNIIPMVKLDVIYRQKGESKIVINSNKLNHQDFNFEYDDTFKFYDEYNPEKVRDIIVNLFVNELQKPNKSLDNVQILTPFKKDKIPCSTFEFNNLIQKSVNPINPNKMFMKVGRYTFSKGDKVIQQRNNDIAKNGDIGYIQSIEFDGTENFAVIDFVDGEQVKYSRADM